MKPILSIALVSLCLLAGNVGAVEFPSGDVPSNVGVQMHIQPGFMSAEWAWDDYIPKLDLVQQAGIGVVRIGIDWGYVEPTLGARDWSNYDQFIRACADRGIRVMATLGGGNYVYGDILDPDYFDNNDFRNACSAYIGDVVARYSNFTDSHGAPIPKMTYELWNEPNGGGYFWARDTTITKNPETGEYYVANMELEKQYVRRAANQYMALATQVMPIIRQNDPNATIVAPGLSWANEDYHPELAEEYINTCFNYTSQYGTHGLLDSATINGQSVTLIDGLSVHPYRYSNPESVTVATAGMNYARVQQMINDAVPGSPVKIISGEWGYPQTYWSHITPQLQADYVQREMLTNVSLNMPCSIWYDFQDNFVEGPNGENNFGLLTLDGTKKPAYHAMQAMNSNLKNFNYAGQWSVEGHENDWLLVFLNSQTGRGKFVTWASTPEANGVATLPYDLGTTYLNGTPIYLGEVQNLVSGGAWSTASWSNSANGGWVNESQASFDINTTIDVDTPVTVSGLQFNSGTLNSTLTNTTGNGRLRIGLGGAAIHVAKAGSSSATINAPLVNENEDIPCNPAVCQVRKTGPGTLVLNARNTFTGSLLIAQGSVKANVADALYGPVVTLLSNATNGGLTFGSSTEFHIGGLAGNKNLNYGSRILDIGESGVSNDADGLGYAGHLTGSGAIRKYGAGTFLLSYTDNDLSGAIDVYGGMLAVSNDGALNGGSSAVALHGGGIDIRGCTLSRAVTTDTTPSTLANSAWYTTSTLASNLDMNADVTIATNGTLNVAGRLGSATTDTHTATKIGAGTLILSGSDDNGYMDLVVNQGIAQLSKASTESIHAADNVTVASGATVQYQGLGDRQVWNSITLGGGTVDFNGHNQTGTSMAITTSGSTIANTSANYSVYTPSSIAVSPISGFYVNVSNPTSILAIEAPIVCNTANGSVWPQLLKIGPGALILGGPGDNTDLTLVVHEGLVAFNKASSPTVHTAAAAAVFSGAKLQLATYGGDYQLRSDPGYWVALSGGTLDLYGASQIGTNFSVDTAGSTLANGLANTNSVYAPNSFNYQQNLTINTVGNLEINGGIVGTTDWPFLTKTGAGTLTLSGSADNTNTTLIASEGTVKLNKTNSTWGRNAATAVAVFSGATVQYTGSGDYQVAGGNWIHLLGGTLDLNGRNQDYIAFSTISGCTGSTLANTAVGTTSVFTPNGTNLDADLTVHAVGNLTFDGVVAGTGRLIKTGTGTATLTKANTYSGGTTAKRGTLLADFSAAGAPTTNILPSAYALTLAGGTFRAKFNSSSNAQTVSGTTVDSGASAVTADTAAGIVYLNTITRNAGGTVKFSPANGAKIRTTTANCNFSGGQQTILGGYATYGGNTWAKTNTGTGTWDITGLTAFQNGFASGKDVNALTTNTITDNMTINSLRFNNAAAMTVNINAATNKTLTIASGGILMTPSAGAVTINSTGAGTGSLTTGNSYDLIVHQNNTANALTINANIMGTSLGLTKSGPGRLILAGNKSYTGATTVNEGALVLSSGTLNGTSDITLNGGGTLLQNSSTALTKSITFNGGTLGGTGTYAYPTADGTLTIGNGSHLAPGDPTVNISNHGLGLGTLTISDTGNWTLGMDSNTVLDYDLNTVGGANYSDLLQLSSGTSCNVILDGTLNVSGISVGLGTYTIISGATSITDMGLIMPADGYMGHHWSYQINGGNVTVTTAPEPGTVVLLTMAFLSLASYAWRKRRSGK
jgi:autotransporter-associated beta strand protein